MNRRALRYLRPYRHRLALVVLISLVSTGLALWLPYLTKTLVDDALIGRSREALVRVVALFAGIGAIGLVLNVVSGLIYTRVSADILFDMRKELYEHLQRLSPRFYARTRLGDIVSRINNDIGEIQRIAAEVALAWVGNVLFLTGSIIVLFWLDWQLFVVGLATLPFSMWALVIYRRQLDTRVTDLRERSASIGSFLIETLQANRTVVTSGAERREVGRFSKLNQAFIAALMGVQRVHYISGGMPSLLLVIGSAAVFSYGGWRVVEGTMTMGTLAAFMAYQAKVVAPVQALMGLYGSLATAQVSWRRVAEVLDTAPEVVEAPDAVALSEVKGAVEFDGVTLSYGRGGAVIEDIGFRVDPGQTLAVVGASGSGKSTVSDMLLRLLDPDAGAVRLDGHDLKRLRLADLRRHIQVVEQEPLLFHASVESNIRYANPDATDAEVIAAVETVGLTTFVAALPDGLRTVVGDRGMALSAGERQRIALARAIVARPSVLILDEPSAALDPVSERHIIDGYRRVMQGRTVIVISHRLEVVRAADQVVVIQGARIVERGTPADLLSSNGPFATMFASITHATHTTHTTNV
jgi:ATP-binding cassette subfamily B protein